VQDTLQPVSRTRAWRMNETRVYMFLCVRACVFVQRETEAEEIRRNELRAIRIASNARLLVLFW